MTIAITGASGHLGRLIIAGLLERASVSGIVALARTPSKVQDLAAKGVDVRPADYRNSETLGPALSGVKTLLFVSSGDLEARVDQHRRVLEAAKRAGVQHVIYTSILRATDSPLILAADHAATEKLLETLGIPFTVLRNGWYLENYFRDLPTTLKHGIAGCSGQGRISGAARADFAAAAVAVLTTGGHEGRRYELAGDESFTKAEVAAELSKQVGKAVPHADLTADAFKQVLINAGVPGVFADIYVDADVQIAKGALQDDSKTLSKLIGRPTTSLAAAVKAALAGPNEA